MRIGRIIAASIVGGIAVFLWGFVSHTVLPIGEMGLEMVWDDAPVIKAMGENMDERGVYVFPSMHSGDRSDADERKRWEEAYAAGPRGMVVYDPSGSAMMEPMMLGIELLSGLVAAFIAALVSSRLNAGYLARVLAIGAMGVFGWLAIDVSYWNWYRFSDLFALAELIDQAAGWTLAGAFIAGIARPVRVAGPLPPGIAPEAK